MYKRTTKVEVEKAMAPHSSTLAWQIPWTEEPGGLQSMGSLRVGHDWATSLSLFTFMHWRRKWQPTPVFSPGESQGWGSLVGCSLWGHTESDTTEVTQQQGWSSFCHFTLKHFFFNVFIICVLSPLQNTFIMSLPGGRWFIKRSSISVILYSFGCPFNDCLYYIKYNWFLD